MDIKFYIPKDITIPTELRLVVDGVNVHYKRINGGFEFRIGVSDDDKAIEIANEIIAVMKNEHDESQHGVSWRTLSVDLIPSDWDFERTVIWKYRVRDSF